MLFNEQDALLDNEIPGNKGMARGKLQ